MDKAGLMQALDNVAHSYTIELVSQIKAVVDQLPTTQAVLDVEGIEKQRGLNSCIADNRCHAKADDKLLDDIINGKYTVKKPAVKSFDSTGWYNMINERVKQGDWVGLQAVAHNLLELLAYYYKPPTTPAVEIDLDAIARAVELSKEVGEKEFISYVDNLVKDIRSNQYTSKAKSLPVLNLKKWEQNYFDITRSKETKDMYGCFSDLCLLIETIFAVLRAGATVKPVGVDVDEWRERFDLELDDLIAQETTSRRLAMRYRELVYELLSTIRKSQEGKGWVVVHRLFDVGCYTIYNPRLEKYANWEDSKGNQCYTYVKSEAQAKCDELNGDKPTAIQRATKLAAKQVNEAFGQPDQRGKWWFYEQPDGWLLHQGGMTYGRIIGVDEQMRETILTALNGTGKE